METEDADYRQIKHTYNQGADDYSGYFKQPHDFIDPERQQFIERLMPGSKILDCGSGPGMDSERFVQLGYKVTAIDFSDRFVELTKKRVPNADVRKMDMRHLAFPDHSFDGLWCSFSLLHIHAAEIHGTVAGFSSV